MNSPRVEIISADRIPKRKRKSPMAILREQAGGDYWIYKEVAAHFGVHTETIRRACRATGPDGKELVKAPSQGVRKGDTTIYLFSKDDVRELEDYFENAGYSVNRINPRKTLMSQIPEVDG